MRAEAVEEAVPVATQDMCAHAFETLETSFAGRHPSQPRYPDHNCPLFVTWEKEDARRGHRALRGCIGSLDARRLHGGLSEYALISALRDRRFSPIEPAELPALTCSVSLLTAFEPAADFMDWEVGTHGLIISFRDPCKGPSRSATYLPDIASREGWTKKETIDSLIRKAGFSGALTEALRRSLEVTRYQATKCELTFAEYRRRYC